MEWIELLHSKIAWMQGLKAAVVGRRCSRGRHFFVILPQPAMSPQIFFTKTVSKFRNDVNKARVELSEDRKNRYKKVDVYAERYQGATTYLKPC